MHKRPFLLFLALLSLLMLGLAACNGDEGESDAEPVDPAQLIEAAAAQLDAVNSFQLALEVGGPSVALNAETIGLDIPITLQRAEGVYVRPGGLQANVTVLLDDVATEIGVIAVDQDQYLNHALITFGQWQAMTFSEGFNPANLGAGEDSIATALRSLRDVEYVGEEDLDGLPVHHIRGTVDAERVQAVTVSLIVAETGEIKADLYIRKGDGQLEQLVLQEPSPEATDDPITWTIGLYDYDGDYTVTRPITN